MSIDPTPFDPPDCSSAVAVAAGRRAPGSRRRRRAVRWRRRAENTPLTVGLGYIPSVQFAQFYLAEEAGYYDEAGLGGDVPEQDRS